MAWCCSMINMIDLCCKNRQMRGIFDLWNVFVNLEVDFAHVLFIRQMPSTKVHRIFRCTWIFTAIWGKRMTASFARLQRGRKTWWNTSYQRSSAHSLTSVAMSTTPTWRHFGEAYLVCISNHKDCHLSFRIGVKVWKWSHKPSQFVIIFNPWAVSVF